MKKIYIALFLSTAVAFSSCDMDIPQEGVITVENSLETKADCAKFMNTIYNNLRSYTAGGYISKSDLQMDQFVGTVNNGNRNMLFSSASVTAGDGDVTSIFASMYYAINNCNFFIPGAQAIIEKGELFDQDLEVIKYNIGEAKFARAYFYWYLLDHFCPAYTSANASTPDLGMPIVLTYDPSADRSKYPGRSTLQGLVDQINKDLSEAYTAIKYYEDNVSMENVVPCATRINSYAVEALQARVALITGDYTTALNKAEDVIGSQKFALCEGDDYKAIWTDDEGTELIFVPFGNKTEVSSVPATGSAWLTNDDENTSDFIPTPEAFTAFGSKDIRRSAFFTIYAFEFEGTSAQGLAFNKYPGNTIFNQGNENPIKNKPKPFRTSELYLIAAESAAANNQLAEANAYLNELRAARIAGYTNVDYNASAIMTQIRNERYKELIGEGFRMSDLRRWGLGFTRTCDYTTLGLSPTLNSFIQPNSLNVTYTPGYYMYVWPIPQAEMDVNPQLKGHQNTGY